MRNFIRNRIGFHLGSGGNKQGWGDYVRALDAAGIPAVLASVGSEGFGDIKACWDNGSTVEHTAVIRCLSHNDVPLYGADIQTAVNDWLDRYVPHIGADIDQYHERVITKHGNELSREQIVWLADFYTALHPALLQRMGWQEHRICVFNFSTGVPEKEQWESILPFLRLAGENPDKFVIGVHEYSLDENDIFNDFPHLVGRVGALYDVCDEHGIPRPLTFSHEWGWRQEMVPETLNAVADVDYAMAMYAERCGTKWLGGGIWTTQEWQGSGIENEVQKMIEPITDLTLNTLYEAGDDGVIPPGGAMFLNPCFSNGWSTKENGNQIPNDWGMVESTVGTVLPNGEVVTGEPECVHKLVQQLPPDEQEELILCGDAVYKCFGQNRVWGVTLYNTIMDLEPGVKYIVGGNFRVHYHDAQNEPEHFNVIVTANEGRVAVDSSTLLDRTWKTVEVEATADRYGIIAYSIVAFNRWLTTDDLFLDAFYTIRVVGEPEPDPCPPRIGDAIEPYNRTYYRVSQNATKDEFLRTAELAYDTRSTIGFSADDAGIGVGLASKTVVEVGYEYEPDVIERWYFTNYGVDVVAHQDYPDGGDTPPPPVGESDVKFGIHCSADSVVTDGDMEMLNAMKPDAIKVLSGTPEHDVARLVAKFPDAHYVVRAFLSFGGRAVTPQQFIDWTIGDVARTVDVLVAHGVGRDRLAIELHNEPNLTTEGLTHAWGDGIDFGNWLSEVATFYRQALGAKARLLYPGLSPGEAIGGLRQESKAFFETSAFVLSELDGVAVHTYWSPGYDLWTHPYAAAETVKFYNAHSSGMPLYITEASNNSGTVSHLEKVAQYIGYWEWLKTQPNIETLHFFVLSATNPEWGDEGSKETWTMTMANNAGRR